MMRVVVCWGLYWGFNFGKLPSRRIRLKVLRLLFGAFFSWEWLREEKVVV